MSARKQIQEAYIAFYGRPADPAGLEYWSKQLESSGGLGAVINAFGNSAESQTLYAGDDNSERVSKVYRQILDREPDAEGLDYYVEQLDSGAITLQSLALSIYQGAQGQDRLLVDKKYAAANQLTQSLDKEGAGHYYKGDADAERARDLLQGVTLGSDENVFSQGVSTFIESIYDSNYYSISGSYASYAGSVIGADGEFAYVSDSWTGVGPGQGYNSEIYLAKINGSLQVSREVLVGNSDDQNVRAYAVTQDGGVVVAGSQNSSDEGFVTKVDSDLNVVGAAKVGNGDGFVSLDAITSTDDGHIVVVGEQNAVADGDDAYIVSFNADMSVHAQRRLDLGSEVNSDESFENVTALSGNRVLAWEDKHAVLFDKDLRVIEDKVFDFSLEDVLKLDNGKILVNDPGYRDKLVLLDQDLSIEGAWSSPLGVRDMSLNDNSVLGVNFSGRLGDISYPTAFFDGKSFENAGGDISSQDVKYISTRSGYFSSPDTILSNGEEFVLQEDGDSLFTMKPQHASSPNPSSDYRLNDLDGEELVFESLDTSSSQYPSAAEGQWESSDIDLVGIANFGRVGMEGGLYTTLESTM